MKFDQTNRKDLRDLFCNAVTKVFGDSMTFLDFLENEEYSTIKYDCYLDYNGENYIINRETGEYINWYKLDHIGRCINISTSSWYKNIPKWIEKFLIEFKESEEGSIYCKEHCLHEAKIEQEPKVDSWSIKDVTDTFKKKTRTNKRAKNKR